MSHRPRHRASTAQKPGLEVATLKLAACLAVLLALAVATQGHAEDYYIYQRPNGELVISNKQPPPGSKIIKQQNLPGVTDSEVPQAQERDVQTEASPKPSNNK